MEDEPSGRDGSFGPVLDALRRAAREVSVAVGHGISAVRHWTEARRFPIRLVILGGFSWSTGRAFGWLLSHLVGVGSWLASSVVGLQPNVQILLFFVVYALHSVTQTKLILGIKTKLGSMDSTEDADVRTDGGGSDGEFSSRIWGLGGLVIGAILGSSFGIDGAFVGAGVGWGLGDELDRRLEAKVNEVGRVPKDGQNSVRET